MTGKTTRRKFSAEYKLRILAEAETSTERGQIGALLRREGLYASTLDKWRQQRLRGTLGAQKRGPKVDEQGTELRRLQREGDHLHLLPLRPLRAEGQQQRLQCPLMSACSCSGGGSGPSAIPVPVPIAVVIGLFAWMGMARLVRASTIEMRRQGFIVLCINYLGDQNLYTRLIRLHGVGAILSP